MLDFRLERDDMTVHETHVGASWPDVALTEQDEAVHASSLGEVDEFHDRCSHFRHCNAPSDDVQSTDGRPAGRSHLLKRQTPCGGIKPVKATDVEICTGATGSRKDDEWEFGLAKTMGDCRGRSAGPTTEQDCHVDEAVQWEKVLVPKIEGWRTPILKLIPSGFVQIG